MSSYSGFGDGSSVNAIVADIGEYATKIGFAGEDYPRSYFRSNVAVLREEEDEEQTIQDIRYDYYTRPICNSASIENGNDGDWEVSNPVDSVTGLWYNNGNNNRGKKASSDSDTDEKSSSNNNANNKNNNDGADWVDLFPKLLQHGYDSALGVAMNHHPLLLVERSYNPPPIRQEVLEILFEECQVPALFLGRDATLACYACGRATATVIDIGYGRTTVTPVFDGYVEQKGIQTIPIGTKHMDEYILRQLQEQLTNESKHSAKSQQSTDVLMPIYQVRKFQKRADPFHHLALMQIAQHCREQGAGACIDTTAIGTASTNTDGTAPTAASASSGRTFQAPSIPFEIPDGQTLNVPSKTRFSAADFLLGGQLDNSQQSLGELRQDIIQDHYSKFRQIIQSANVASVDIQKEEEIRKNNAHLPGAEKEKDLEAEAVGLVSKQQRRDKNSSEPTNKRQKQDRNSRGNAALIITTSQRKNKFSNKYLQHACVNYLQTLLEQQQYYSYYTQQQNQQQQVEDNNKKNGDTVLKDMDPNLVNAFTSIAQMVCDCVFLCDREQQPQLLGNVIVCGGGACLGPTDNAVTECLRTQMERIIHAHTPHWRVKVLSPNIQERSICSWLGGSILGSLGTFHDMWITQEEYNDYGSSAIVNRKCP